MDKEREETIRRIIGCAFDVYNVMHSGLLETVYESALVYELRTAGFEVEQQKELPILYKGISLNKNLRMDVVVDDRIILELKATDAIEPSHRKQLFTYLALTRKPIGIILNFTNNGKVIFEKYWYDAENNRCRAF